MYGRVRVFCGRGTTSVQGISGKSRLLPIIMDLKKENVVKVTSAKAS